MFSLQLVSRKMCVILNMKCSANLKLLVMDVVSVINVASPNKGRHRSDWLV